MNTLSSTVIRRGTEILTVLILLACTAASCRSEKPAAREPHCAFADPEMMTSLGICSIAAEYYIAHHEWPLSKTQIEEQWGKMLEEAKKEMPPEEAKEGAEFLRRFTLLELRKTGDNLLLHYRFTVGTKTVSQKVMLKPGTTADEILQAATDGNN
jgi:hypothetical protein